jgi:predicted adenine nucleotide alpha hydrolase (AANH) superfamily ATPase
MSAIVLDANGQQLSPTTGRARWHLAPLLAQGKAALVGQDGILPHERPGEGKRILLHICCGPCSTYPIERLREEGFQVTGFWYNPNIHPWQEHQCRQQSAQKYAEAVELPVIWYEKYEMPRYLRAVAGHERFRERCRICYRMRLERTAQAAAEGGFDAFTTTLLISPHQDQALIRQIGEEMGEEWGVGFYFENFRRGWSERGRLTHQHGLYRQRYCGCIYSEWERYNEAHIDELLAGLR